VPSDSLILTTCAARRNDSMRHNVLAFRPGIRVHQQQSSSNSLHQRQQTTSLFAFVVLTGLTANQLVAAAVSCVQVHRTQSLVLDSLTRKMIHCVLMSPLQQPTYTNQGSGWPSFTSHCALIRAANDPVASHGNQCRRSEQSCGVRVSAATKSARHHAQGRGTGIGGVGAPNPCCDGCMSFMMQQD
jgi:hypothetical protein